MSPGEVTTVSDQQSETVRRGRPPVRRERVLEAAETLFADAELPGDVSMDDIAAAAGVGKGTLFRAFGSRDGLLDALFAARLEPWREEIQRAGSPIGPDAPPRERVAAILEHLLAFKLENPRLLAARELNGRSLLRAPHYVWVHEVIRDLVEQTGATRTSAGYTAHMLLGGLRIELITALIASGSSPAEIRRDLTSTARRLLDTPAGH